MSIVSRSRVLLVGVAVLALAGVASAQGVFIQSSQTGQGILRSRGSECFILTPLHVIGNALGPVRVIGERATEGKAELFREFPGDLALLRVTEQGTLRCEPWPPSTNVSATLQSQTGGHLTTREPDGSRTLIPVTFRSVDVDRVFVRPTVAGDQLLKGMSGASLLVNGALAGMLLSVDNGDGNVLRVDDIARLTDSFFAVSATNTAAATSRVVDIAAASALLDRAVAARDGSSQGQVAAVADLLANGHRFSSVDWSGVSMKGGQLANAVFTSGRFHFADFGDADLRSSDLSETGLRFGVVAGATLTGANLTRTFAPFLDARGALLDGAVLSAGNFVGADFRGARLQNAKLRGTALAFADLRGANLDGADLTGAYLQGAVIDASTSFKNAIFDDTDVAGATLAAVTLTPQQLGGVCRHPIAGRGERPVDIPLVEYRVTLLEQRASPRFSSGYEFEDLADARWQFGVMAEPWVPACKSKPDGVAADFNARFPGSMQLNLDRTYLSKAGRAREAVRRVTENLELVKAQLRAESNLQPDAARTSRWTAAARSAAAKPAPNGKTYFDADSFLLYALRFKAITPDGVDWVTQARNRFAWEELARNPTASPEPVNTIWTALFPEATSWKFIVDTAPVYQGWSIERAKRTPETITFVSRIAARGAAAANQDGFRLHRVFDQSRLRGDGRAFLEQKNIDLNRVSGDSSFSRAQVYIPVDGRRVEGLPPSVVLPNAISSYRLAVPPTVPMEDALVEIDATVTGADKTADNVLLSITPTIGRVVRDGKIVWSGPVEHSPVAARGR